MNESINSARAAASAFEKEQRQIENAKREREFDKTLYLEIVKELKSENLLLSEQYKEIKKELKETKKYNQTIIILTIVSIVVAIVAVIVAILK